MQLVLHSPSQSVSTKHLLSSVPRHKVHTQLLRAYLCSPGSSYPQSKLACDVSPSTQVKWHWLLGSQRWHHSSQSLAVISQLTNVMLGLAWPKACVLKQQLREYVTWDSHSIEFPRWCVLGRGLAELICQKNQALGWEDSSDWKMFVTHVKHEDPSSGPWPASSTKDSSTTDYTYDPNPGEMATGTSCGLLARLAS